MRRRLATTLLVLTCAASLLSIPRRSVRQDGGVLVRRLESAVRTLNPVLAREVSERYVCQYLFTPLLYLDSHQRPVPGLAELPSISEDRRVYRFRVNPRATFSDGKRVRARDVVFTLTKMADPRVGAQHASSFEHLQRAVSLDDDQTVLVEFRVALATQLASFADVLVVPEHVYGAGNFADYYGRAVGSGPYTLERRDADTLVLKRRDTYWRDKPSIERVVLKVIDDYGQAWRALKRGEIDESYIPSTAWERERTSTEVRERLQLHAFYTGEFSCIMWNTRHPILRDQHVRRALAMSLDVDELVQSLHGGMGRVLTGPFTPDHAGYDSTVRAVPYAPDRAVQLLAQLGWRDTNRDGILDKGGVPLRFVLLTPDKTTLYAQVVQAALKRIGVEVELETPEFNSMHTQIRNGNYDAAYFQWTLDPDPDLYSMFHSSQDGEHGANVVGYASRDVDALLEQARTEFDPRRRQALNRRIHAILAEEQPYSWYIQVPAKWGIAKKVRGVERSPLRGLFLWYPGELGWWISRE